MGKRYTFDGKPIARGNELPQSLQREALARYVHRFTGEHKPKWANAEWKDGKPYPLQFATDAEWLANTTFCVNLRNGQITGLADADCHSQATWPNNPELRRTIPIAPAPAN